MKRAFFLFAFILALLTGTLPATAAAQIPAPGMEAPLFSLPDITGKTHSLQEYRGKVVLLTFWATWCTSCTAELPGLNRLHDAFSDKELAVITVSLDKDADTVRAFLRKKGITLPALVDTEKEVSFDLYLVTALPAAFLIDRSGHIVRKYLGEQDWESPSLRKGISDALAGKGNGP